MLEQLRSRWRDQPCDGIRVQWPEVGRDRVRRVITRSGVRRRYAIPCYRDGDREAQCEAAEEAAACILLDACPGIEFQEQPLTLTFSWLGKPHQHVPDLLVASPGRYEFWECKRDTEARNFWIRKRAERLQTLLAPTGVGYRVVTGREVFAGHYLENARLLRRFATHRVPSSVESEAELQVRQTGTVTIQRIQRALRTGTGIADILALVYRGDLSVDLNVRLTAQSLVFLPDRNRRLPWVWQLFAAVSA